MQMEQINITGGQLASLPKQRCHVSRPLKKRKTKAATITEAPVTNSRSQVQIPADIQNSVVRLKAPNPDAPGGETDVFLLGMSHVSQESVQAVRSLIEAVKPEVIMVELCKDRVSLMMNPDGPKALQLWNTRRIRVTGYPTKMEGWPSEEEILSVINLKPEKAFTTPDAEMDCVNLLSTGLFKSARPVFRRPNKLDGPHFVEVKGNRIATVPPLGTVEFAVLPRILPSPTSFNVRIDSSLAKAGIDIPQEEVDQIRSSLLSPFFTPEQLVAQEASIREAEQPQQENSETSSSAAPSPENNIPKTKEDLKEELKEGSETDLSAEAKPDDSEEQAESKKVKVASIDALLKARQDLMKLMQPRIKENFDISLQGVESGQIEAVIKARQSQVYTSGLEGSAINGEGSGIEKFKPQRGPLQVSKNLKIPNVAKVLLREGENSDGYVIYREEASAHSQWKPWNPEIIDRTNLEDSPNEAKQSLVEKIANGLTSLYGRLQSKAGEVTGVKAGAAWIEALEAGSENGAQQIHLGDMPSDLVGKDLARGIWDGLSVRIQVAALVAALSATLAVTHALPDGAEPLAVGAVAAATSLAILPFLAPLLEVYLFSRKSPEDIEKSVRITESLQERGHEMLRLSGEDAIVSWPNAKSTVIDQRDAYMARTLWAAATGGGAAPAFVRDEKNGRHAWHYVMPSEAPEAVSKEGLGLGKYNGVKGVRTVVGIVGSAHVGGMLREWSAADDKAKLTELLQKDR